MGNPYYECPLPVTIPPAKPFLESIKLGIKETLFPDDPFRQFKNQPASRKFILGMQYFVPILEWAPRYTFEFFKADLIAGITIASLAVPQGISYASLASLPPIIGLYSSFVPPLVYAMLGSSKDLAVGTVAVASLLISSMLGKEVNPNENARLYVQLALTATFFAGVFQAALGLLRLGFIVDFLSHATIVGFMGGAATVVCLQQLKGILGLVRFTHGTDLVSVLRSVFSQTHQWRWESGVLGCCFLFFLVLTRYVSKRKPCFFWINAMAPMMSVIVGSVLVYLTNAEKYGVQVEGVAVGRSFAMFKNYHIDGNKEMIAFGMMNIAGSCVSCYLTTGPFSRTAVNFNAGCKTAGSNIVMAAAVMVTLLFLTPLFHYTPIVVLSSIIIAAMLGLIDYEAAIGLWKVDKCDFIVCVSAYIGVVFGSVEIGLVIAVTISLLRMLLSVARPRTFLLGNIPNSMIFRSIDQYPIANNIPGVLILQIDAPVYFANANYLRERWIYEEDEKLKSTGGSSLQYVILDLSAVGSTDTSGISMFKEVKKNIDRRGLKLVLANPRSEVIKKLVKSKFIESIGQEWIYLTVGEAVAACNFMLHASKSNNQVADEFDAHNNA
ncbi:sulfate transporter 3.1 isoform X5 [Populus trichocarpa]|uniref:STAS domain-containing protein n=1 Tax=Populus trichocarpa TaxID=3694 RepID=A0A3N7FHG1_POPTR|nr:sulfate transporter 3.1 isoform X5 [Populus trichocarpa]|eukprot:XP_024463148.1 sulfate transporter 3.1 isoform X2 [Populus trichocarpa]